MSFPPDWWQRAGGKLMLPEKERLKFGVLGGCNSASAEVQCPEDPVPVALSAPAARAGRMLVPDGAAGIGWVLPWLWVLFAPSLFAAGVGRESTALAGVCWLSSVSVSPCWQGSWGAPVVEHLPPHWLLP